MGVAGPLNKMTKVATDVAAVKTELLEYNALIAAQEKVVTD